MFSLLPICPYFSVYHLQQDGASALLLAYMARLPKTAEILIRRGANVNIQMKVNTSKRACIIYWY